MTAGAEASRAIVGAMVGLLYGSVLALLSLFLFGGGGAHGTSIPLLLSSAPLGVFALVGKLVGEPYMGYGDNATVLGAPLVWAGLGWLVALSGRGRLRLARILALLHYASGLALIATAGEEPGRLERLVQISPALVMWATIYLAGQAALWSSMRAGPEARQAIVGAMVGLLYGSVLAFLSLGAIGGGHGSIVPLLLSSAPLGVLLLVGNLVGASHVGEAILFAMLYGTPLIWTALGSVVALSGRGTSLSLTRVLVLLQYASGLALVATTVGWLTDFPAVSVESAAVGRYVGDGLPGWAGGVVVANKQAQSTSTDRLTTACGRNSRSRHRNDLRSQTALPKQTQQNRLTAPVPVAPQQSSEIW